MVTTFVIATYPSLQPDNTDEMVFLMRHLLAQSYTFDGGLLNPTDPPFEVPLWALRVNGLWFASLIISLSTASIGMLVKQWLTEYLAMEWISPQEQLRARQYRRPALEGWKVFEIAAILPLFLHISLGLFFIGLCFYTAAANYTIGLSTFPLVVGWAFVAIMTTIAPILTPRCPYKVTLFKAALRSVRRYVTSRLWVPMNWTGRIIISAMGWFWDNVIRLPFTVFDAFVSGFSALVEVARDFFFILGFIVFLFYAPFGLIKHSFTILSKAVHAVIVDPQTDKDEEEDVVKQEQEHPDHELLLAVDAVLVNDGPILETMVDVLRQTQTPPSYTVAFVLGCLRHRIGAAEAAVRVPDIYGGTQGLLNLQPLSESAWNLLMGLVGETLDSDVEDKAHNDWATTAAAVLLSDSQRLLPSSAYTVLYNPSRLPTILQRVGVLVRS